MDEKKRTIHPILSDDAPDLTMPEIIMRIRGSYYSNSQGGDWDKLRTDLVAALGVVNETILDDTHDYFESLVVNHLHGVVVEGNVVLASLLEQFSYMMDRRWVEPEVVEMKNDHGMWCHEVEDFEWEDDDD